MPTSAATAPSAATQSPTGSADRTDRYMARLAGHLDTLPAAERVAFLSKELTKWIARYERFVADVDRGTYDDVDGGPDAWDYLLTITAIGSRLEQERRAQS